MDSIHTRNTRQCYGFCKIIKMTMLSKVTSGNLYQIQKISENYDIPEEPEKLRFASFIIWLHNILFIIDIIDNIFDTSVSLDQNFNQWQYSIIVTWYRHFTFTSFGIILTKFYINFSRQEHQRENSSRSGSTPKMLRFQPITPFIFPLI